MASLVQQLPGSLAWTLLDAALSKREDDQPDLPYTDSRRHAIRVCGIVASSISLLTGLVGFYTMGFVHRKKFSFRLQLILLLIAFDFVKATCLLIYPITIEASLERMASSRVFTNVIGWLTTAAVEAGDVLILAFSVHFLLIFFPNWNLGRRLGTSPQHQSQKEGGLYPYRYWIYGSCILVPALISSVAFTCTPSYTSSINWSYLTKLRPVWYFAWISRYCIVIVILIIYVSVYVHVMRQYKVVSSKMDLENSEAPGIMSELLADSIWFKLGKMLLMLVFPDVRISAKLHGRELNSSADLENLRSLDKRNGFEPSSDDPDYDAYLNASGSSGGTGSTTVHDLPNPMLDKMDGEFDGSDEERARRIQQEMGLDIQRMLHREAMDRFQLRRLQIMKQMKVIFVYPISYLLLWFFPFIHQCYILKGGGDTPNCFYAYATSAFFQPFNCTIDTLVFLYRERPWTLTAQKVDPFCRSHYSAFRRAISFLPGYGLGGGQSAKLCAHSMCKGGGSSSNGGDTLEMDGTSFDVSRDLRGVRNSRVNPLTPSERAALSDPTPQTLPYPPQVHFNTPTFGNVVDLDDEDVSGFVRAPPSGEGTAGLLNPRDSTAMGPSDSELSMKDFLNSILPTDPLEADSVDPFVPVPAEAALKDSTVRDSRRPSDRHRSSYFSWKKALSLKGQTTASGSVGPAGSHKDSIDPTSPTTLS